MQGNRKEVEALFGRVAVGLSRKELLEQSNCFIFQGGRVSTFNDEIMAEADSPFDIEGAVPAELLLKLLSKFPDEVLAVTSDSTELKIKGKRKKAGVAFSADIHLPISEVPTASEWHELGEEIPPMLRRAAMTCGNDETQYQTTCVHVTENMIEACDNYRLFRATMPTGFPSEILIPGPIVGAICRFTLTEVSVGEGWCFFKTKEGVDLSVRCSHESYKLKTDDVLNVQGGERLSLPVDLPSILERAEIMVETGYDATVLVNIEEGRMSVKSRKDGGWYQESKKVKYKGPGIAFEVHPKFLAEILDFTRRVVVADGRMKLSKAPIEFVVGLAKGGDEEMVEEESEE